jgi:hypothetical protein
MRGKTMWLGLFLTWGLTGARAATVTLTWQAPAPDAEHDAATGYRLFYAQSSLLSLSTTAAVNDGTVRKKTAPGRETTVDITGADTTWYFRLTATNAGGESEFGTEPDEYSVYLNPSGTPIITPSSGRTGDLKDAYAYPNPAVGQPPTIRATLGDVQTVELTIFNAGGRMVRSASLPAIPAGTTSSGETFYEYAWERPEASGTYYAVIHGKTSAGKTVRARARFAVVR